MVRSLKSLSISSLLLSTLSFGASAADASYEMHAYLDYPGGAAVVAGDYAGAIAAASQPALLRSSATALVASTNLCVAYTLDGSFAEAFGACEKAYSLAKLADSGTPYMNRDLTATAKALSNLGVLRAVTGDSMGAETAFLEAVKLGGGWETPTRNLAYLETTPAYRLARLATAN